MELSEIRKKLQENSTEKSRKSWKKFTPTAEKVYGCTVPIITGICKKIINPTFDLTRELWQGEYVEEKILAAKILNKIGKNDPQRTIELLEKFSKTISDWAVCDTLAMQGVNKISKIKQKEIFNLSRRLIKSRNLWQRRFGLVLLVNYVKEKELKKDIEEIIKMVQNDNKYYVKKAIIWLKTQISKYNEC
ncbi:MAG: DNA alkylation repair protein [bacterium]|nr:DNA alkylation repair protein [bacterium]